VATREEVLREIKTCETRWKIGQRSWSFAYHSLGIGAITTALLTTIGSAIGWDKAVLVVLGAITTALTTLTGLLRPASKWRSNRLSHSEAEAIRRYLMQDKASPDKALQRIAALALAHDRAVVGDIGTDITAGSGAATSPQGDTAESNREGHHPPPPPTAT